MPLVVPGITTTTTLEEWQNKLVGKTLSDGPSDALTFCKKDLPEGTRVIVEPGARVTKDHQPDRLNVHVAEDGTVARVYHG